MSASGRKTDRLRRARSRRHFAILPLSAVAGRGGHRGHLLCPQQDAPAAAWIGTTGPLRDDLGPEERFRQPDRSIEPAARARTELTSVPAQTPYPRGGTRARREMGRAPGEPGQSNCLQDRPLLARQSQSPRPIPRARCRSCISRRWRVFRISASSACRKTTGSKNSASAPGGLEIETLGSEFDAGPDAFVDAAVIQALGLVITCDTSVAPLAGALGRPTFLLLKKIPIGAGCSIATIRPGIRPCGCSGKRRAAIGTR